MSRLTGDFMVDNGYSATGGKACVLCQFSLAQFGGCQCTKGQKMGDAFPMVANMGYCKGFQKHFGLKEKLE